MVTLHEAIEHAREVSRRGCTKCHKEHGQLADWLEELEWRREEETQARIRYRARWRLVTTISGSSFLECPWCGYKEHDHVKYTRFNFCPSCGAQLGREEEPSDGNAEL